MAKSNTSPDIHLLNSFLCGEMSAVSTYRSALDVLPRDPVVRSILEACRDSHQRRVSILRGEIERLGGEPAEGAGAWSAFARILARGAETMGREATLAALVEGEDHGLRRYDSDLEGLSAPCREFVRCYLMPEQQRTNDTLSAIQGSP